MKILSAEFSGSAARPDQFPADAKPQVAFAGRSNVGKSSLINALLHRNNLVKTSSTPGKTQLVNFFLINERFYFTDLPGYGYAKAPKAVVDAWGPLIEGYLKNAPQLRAVVLLLDGRREPDVRDRLMLEWLGQYGIPALIVLTKADKLNRQEAAKAGRATAAHLKLAAPPILSSAREGTGMKELWAALSPLLASD